MELITDADSVVRNAKCVFHHVYADGTVVFWNRLAHVLYSFRIVSITFYCILIAPGIDLTIFFVWMGLISFIFFILSIFFCYVSSLFARSAKIK